MCLVVLALFQRLPGLLELLLPGLQAEELPQRGGGNCQFYLARALHYTGELEAKTHGDMNHPLSIHFVRTARQDPAALIRAYIQAQQAREDADYQSALVFDAPSAAQAQEQLQVFREAVATCLEREGFVWPAATKREKFTRQFASVHGTATSWQCGPPIMPETTRE